MIFKYVKKNFKFCLGKNLNCFVEVKGVLRGR